jgi:hypothetical protein
VFVYIITEIPPNDFVKVGVTRHDPYKRLSNLQTGNPRILDLVCWIGIKDETDARQLEKELISVSRYFENRHGQASPEGEWIWGCADRKWWAEYLTDAAEMIGAEVEGVSA